MKKLMVFAAAAVMSGVAAFGYEGDADVYTIKLKLRTTKAATSKSTSKTYGVNFGMDAKKDGTFWYMDDAITQNDTLSNYGDVAGYNAVVAYEAGFKTSAGKFTEAFFNLDGADQLVIVEELGYNPSTQKTPYCYKSANKWCQSFKIKVVTPSECYRVDAIEKIVGYLVMEDCCGSTWMVYDKNFENGEPVTMLCNYRYGSNVDANAKKVEVKLSIGSFGDVNSIVLGGHGTYDAKNQRISSISGYAIGMLEGPRCESCCAASIASKCFDCENTKVEAPDTVAYGIFSISFDKKATANYCDL